MSNKITEITVETEQILIVRRPTGGGEAWCDGCAAIVRMVTPEEAATLTQTTTRDLYRRVEAGEMHFAERPEGALLLCLNSLTI
jgi:lipoate-protein ligase A